jgi:hypothetical protein
MKKKEKRAAELAVANKELAFQNEKRKKTRSELIIANKKFFKIPKRKTSSRTNHNNAELVFKMKKRKPTSD